ncbi:SMR family transporter [Staphylococcus saprophyticus]|uniref:DMT family transporter n=1 Tax=Staphylococcus sp. HMSC034G07 TaxID=1715065 RepID=UPI0008A9FA35|nr:SMR family transporter [Staphylococcus sp. HMSC034G07]MDW4013798.1 SMR family transporter [Staphylococcus saprophyticus]MDW4063897.1 SMR family transporter [Staphylococcus saprophyticus]OHO42501.1 quaternary ammonium transporter [Staphylococcus sp. HMSC034G07]
MPYIYLLGAILSEVFGTTMMKLTATSDNKLYIVGIAGGYILAFFLLSLSLISLPLSFGYAVWSGAGTAFTAMVGFLVFKEQITKNALIGIILIIVGVVLMRV